MKKGKQRNKEGDASHFKLSDEELSVILKEYGRVWWQAPFRRTGQCPPHEVIDQYASGEISGGYSDKVRNHLDRCDYCKRRFLTIMKAIRLLDEDPSLETSLLAKSLNL